MHTIQHTKKHISAEMTMCDDTVRDSQAVCNLLLDPPHLWALLELVHLYHS